MNVSDGLQLATTQDMKKIKFPARAERKMDGVRVMMLNGKFYSRKGKEIVLPKTSETIAPIKLLMLDLEVTLESGKVEDRPKVSGMLNSAMKGGSCDEDLLYFNIIDVMTNTLYNSREPFESYRERLKSIQIVLDTLRTEKFRPVPYRNIYNVEQLSDYYDNEVSKGYEGVVVKQYDDTYKFGRSKQWARFKETKTADLLCVYVNKGTGKYTDMIGALVLEGEVDGNTIVVKVGSGLTDYDRSFTATHFLGKTIEVKYNSITKNKDTGQKSLFLPRFVTVREDK